MLKRIWRAIWGRKSEAYSTQELLWTRVLIDPVPGHQSTDRRDFVTILRPAKIEPRSAE